MARPHDPEWRWRVGSAEYHKQRQAAHKKREQVKRENYKANPLDMWQSERAMVRYFYEYARDHGFDNMVVPNNVYSVVSSKLTWKFNFEITWQNVMDQMTKLRRNFFYFREFLDFPGIRLADDKKYVHADLEYFVDLAGEEECWLYKSFRLFGFDHHKELQFIVINKKIGGMSMECGMHDWFYIKGRNSDMGEEIIQVYDYNADTI